MENKQMAAQVYDVAQRVIFDPDTGDVFASFNRNVIPLGNIRTGNIYLYRQYPISDAGQMDMPAEHKGAWTVKVPDGTLEVQLSFVQQMSTYLNMGYQQHAAAAQSTTVGDLLTMVTDSVIPDLVERKATAMHVVLLAADALLEHRRGRAGAYELNKELERMVGFISTMPEAFVTAPIAWKKEGVTLVDSGGQRLQ
jgi:hypothetical protein